MEKDCSRYREADVILRRLLLEKTEWKALQWDKELILHKKEVLKSHFKTF